MEEVRALRREKELILEELYKAQDNISRMKIEKNNKTIDLYDPNNPDILHRKISKIFFISNIFKVKKIIKFFF